MAGVKGMDRTCPFMDYVRVTIAYNDINDTLQRLTYMCLKYLRHGWFSG